MTLPRWDSVAALYCLQKSMMLTPCGPRAVPTGGAGVAAPAFSCTLTTAAIFFFLGAISWVLTCVLYYARRGQMSWSELGDLVERKLDRRLPAEDRHQHLELLGVGVDLVRGRRERCERAVHYRNGFADGKFHRGPGDLGPGRGLLRLGREQRGHLAERQRGGPARQADEAGDPGGGADHGPGFVGEIHPGQDVTGEHLLRDPLPLPAP